ncbi:unnamed protein product, partial [Symbiodinium pilosum]
SPWRISRHPPVMIRCARKRTSSVSRVLQWPRRSSPRLSCCGRIRRTGWSDHGRR